MGSAIEFRLGADSRLLKTGLDTAKAQISGFKSQVGGILTGLFAGIGVQALISEFARIQDVADQFGASAESVQRVGGAAAQAGTDLETIAKAMAKIRSDGGDILEKLGIDAKAFTAADLDQQVLMVASALDQVQDP